MENIEKIVIPLTIGAAVLGIWAALRKPGVTVVSTGAGAGVSLAPVAPLLSLNLEPGDDAAGHNIGTHPAYNRAALSDRLNQSPVPINVNVMLDGTGLQGTPAFPSLSRRDGFMPPEYVSALSPWNNASMRSLAKSFGFSPPAGDSHSDCGCGGGCGGGSKSGKGGCNNPKQDNKFLGGSGRCLAPLYSQPTASTQQKVDSILYATEIQYAPGYNFAAPVQSFTTIANY
jgi:hypothetical protein